MQVIDILFISASKNVKFSIVGGSSVTPSGWGSSFSQVYFCAHDHSLGICGIFQEVCQVEDVHFIQVHILTVTTTEGYNLVVIDQGDWVESFGGVVILEVNFWLPPDTLI